MTYSRASTFRISCFHQEYNTICYLTIPSNPSLSFPHSLLHAGVYSLIFSIFTCFSWLLTTEAYGTLENSCKDIHRDSEM